MAPTDPTTHPAAQTSTGMAWSYTTADWSKRLARVAGQLGADCLIGKGPPLPHPGARSKRLDVDRPATAGTGNGFPSCLARRTRPQLLAQRLPDPARAGPANRTPTTGLSTKSPWPCYQRAGSQWPDREGPGFAAQTGPPESAVGGPIRGPLRAILAPAPRSWIMVPSGPISRLATGMLGRAPPISTR